MKKKNMKKNIIKLVLLIIILLAVGTFFIMKSLQEKAKTYELVEIEKEDYQFFVYSTEGKYGVIDKEGKTIIPANYTQVKIPNPSKAIFICYTDDNTQVFNEKNEAIYTDFQNIEPLSLKNISSDLIYEKTVLKYKQDEKYGLVSIEGKKITNPIYESIDTLQYKEGELVVKQDNKSGIININGYEIIKPEYDNIIADGYYSSENGYKNDGYIVSNTTEQGYRYGYVNNEGKKILEPNYNELSRIPYKDENKLYLLCAENGKYGIFEGEKNIIPNEYQDITYVDGNDFCIVQKGKKYGAINLQGSMMLQVKYLQINVNGDYMYVTDENSTQKVYDKKGNETEINPNSVILSINSTEDYKIHIDTIDGTTTYSIYQGDTKLTTENYSYLEYLFENYFIASNTQGKIGVIDANGNIKIEMKYDTLQKIADTDLIQTLESSTKTTSIYSKDLNLVVQMTNANVEKIGNNLIKIYNKEDAQYVDYSGIQKQNTEVYPNNTIFAKSQNGKWGFVGKEGNVVVDYQYDEVTEINEYGFAGVKKDEKWGVIDKNGNIIVDCIYEINNQENPNFIGEYYEVSYGNGESYYTK